MIKTLVLYESRSGFTGKIAERLALILGPAFCSRATEFKGDLDGYDFIVLCTPGHSGVIDKNLLDYAAENSSLIAGKKVILLCTSLDEENAFHCLTPIKNLLGHSVVYTSSIQDEEDGRLIRVALEIKKLRDEIYSAGADPELDKHTEEFISGHNTCALATGHGNTVRVTPIEYIYRDGSFYLLSEGGEKFANILANPNVSLCIYDEFKGMNELGGMQITGTAEIIPIGSEKYLSALEYRKIDYEKQRSMSVALNLIKITVTKIEFLWSEFVKQGLNVKQVRTLI